MIRCFGNFCPVFADLAVGIDPDGRTDRPHNHLAIHLFFAEGPIFFHHLLIRVAQQGKGNAMGVDKLLVRCFGIGRNTQDDRIQFLKLTIQVTEARGFLGSPGGVVLGVKIEYYMLAFKILE